MHREDLARVDEHEELACLKVCAFRELGPIARHRGDRDVDDKPGNQCRGDRADDG
jgi:hypothetical protein